MRQLGELEAVIMDVLWEADTPLSVREVLERMPGDRSRAYTTVMTVLDNLHRKDFAVRERRGRAYHYRSAQSRVEHTAGVMEELLVGSGDTEATLLHFAGQIGPAEALRLRAALAEVDEGNE